MLLHRRIEPQRRAFKCSTHCSLHSIKALTLTSISCFHFRFPFQLSVSEFRSSFPFHPFPLALVMGIPSRKVEALYLSLEPLRVLYTTTTMSNTSNHTKPSLVLPARTQTLCMQFINKSSMLVWSAHAQSYVHSAPECSVQLLWNHWL